MTRKSITTSHAAVACDVCGRTLLRGEHSTSSSRAAPGAPSASCAPPARRTRGWIREGLDLGAGARRGDARRRSLFGRLGRPRRENGHEPLPPRGAERLLADHGHDAVAEMPAAPAEPVYEPPREPRNVHAVPTNAQLKMQRALELFNGSEHPRTVGGVARSLGDPLVTVRPSATEGSVVGITVAWELSWYRYEVDLADEAAGVRVIAQGTELTELDEPDRTPNATADERGDLALVA
jgi:hypothetical protein